jgi:hypothetical protein
LDKRNQHCQNFGSEKLSLLKPWIKQLTNGVKTPVGTVLPVCIHDIKNFHNSPKMWLDSHKPKFKSDVLHTTGVTADDITVFCTIIQKWVLLNASLQRELISTVHLASHTHEECENDDVFNQKLSELITRI